MLEVPVDRLLIPQDPRMLNLQVPRLNTEPSLENYAMQIAKPLLVSIYSAAINNSYPNIYLYNLLSLNNFNNKYWVDLLLFSTEFISAKGYVQNPEIVIIDLYLSNLIYVTNELHNTIDQRAMNSIGQKKREFDFIRNNRRNNGFVGGGQNMNYGNQPNNRFNNNQQFNQQQAYGRPNQAAFGNSRFSNMNPGGVAFGNNNSQGFSNNDNNQDFHNRYDIKNRNSITNVHKESPKESIFIDPLPDKKSLYKPLVTGGWGAKKVINTENNTYSWELVMNEEEHMLSKKERTLDDTDVTNDIKNIIHSTNVEEALDNTIVTTDFDNGLILIKIELDTCIAGDKLPLLYQLVVVHNDTSSNKFRYTDGLPLNDMFSYNDVNSSIDNITSLIEDYSALRDTKNTIKHVNQFITNHINDFLSKYCMSRTVIDSFIEDYKDLLLSLDTNTRERIKLEVDRLISLMSVGVNKELILDVIPKNDGLRNIGISSLVEKFSVITVQDTLNDLSIDGLKDDNSVYKLSRVMDEELYDLANACVVSRDKESFPSIKGFILTKDMALLEISKDPLNDDILISLT